MLGKRTRKCVLSTALAGALLVSTAPAAVGSKTAGLGHLPVPGKGCEWRSTLNNSEAPIKLRSKRSASASTVAMVPIGAYFMYEWCPLYGWTRGVYYGTLGWTTTGDWTHGGGPYDVGTKVTTTAVVLRTGPGIKYKKILTIPKGARVTLQDGSSNGYEKATYKGTIGWVSGQYLR